MSENLKRELQNFLRVTNKIIEDLLQADYDSLDALFDNRQRIIDNIDALDFEKDTFISIAKELGVQEQDIQLNELLVSARVNVRQNIDALSNHWNAKNGYTKKFSVDALYYNKKI